MPGSVLPDHLQIPPAEEMEAKTEKPVNTPEITMKSERNGLWRTVNHTHACKIRF